MCKYYYDRYYHEFVVSININSRSYTTILVYIYIYIYIWHKIVEVHESPLLNVFYELVFKIYINSIIECSTEFDVLSILYSSCKVS